MNPMLLCDFYKLSHRQMYPKGTEYVYSTWTPRASRIPEITHVVNFGLQYFIKKYLIEYFKSEFFEQNVDLIMLNYRSFMKATLGLEEAPVEHIRALHDLGYLPLSIKALPEGELVPLRVPIFTIQNTDSRFFWLTNYIETLMSCELWQPITSATIAREYRKLFEKFSYTCDPDFSVDFQGHDFSMRGMSSLGSAISSGMGHLVYFKGTDTIPAIEETEAYYRAQLFEKVIGTSIPATEHSIQCTYGDDMEYFTKILDEVHPTGIVSIVSDGYDFWDVIGRVLPALREKILNRQGKLVIRPDSGDPVKIVCGDPNGKTELERKGAVEALWDLFGGHMSPTGFRVLHRNIGLIYGDSITLQRAKAILENLHAKEFASSNVVFGIGSYTYQYNTRDTFGFALKSTMCVINGKEKMIFKDPKTDDGVKKSQKGRVAVFKQHGEYYMVDQLHLDDEDIPKDQLVEVFRNGELLLERSFEEIRDRAKL